MAFFVKLEGSQPVPALCHHAGPLEFGWNHQPTFPGGFGTKVMLLASNIYLTIRSIYKSIITQVAR
ncbi:hypothetical protein C0039_03390 [Pseudohalioglobus lutimaris]|uniref:Uncharacterized protein n=1 Tax=Pseudohalioglobus lutimaris TaxID=1737061 RepID=A0A2N5X701_9GAMM|nr:hypothetical protein C0039_03390 [Pseudohalioglobus lutimaris]